MNNLVRKNFSIRKKHKLRVVELEHQVEILQQELKGLHDLKLNYESLIDWKNKEISRLIDKNNSLRQTINENNETYQTVIREIKNQVENYENNLNTKMEQINSDKEGLLILFKRTESKLKYVYYNLLQRINPYITLDPDPTYEGLISSETSVEDFNAYSKNCKDKFFDIKFKMRSYRTLSIALAIGCIILIWKLINN